MGKEEEREASNFQNMTVGRITFLLSFVSLGALIKSYFADKIGVPPEKIMHVSVMPCVAKKDEIKRPQLTQPYITTSGAIKVREKER